MALLFLLFLHLQRRRRPRVVQVHIGRIIGQLHIGPADVASVGQWAAAAGRL